MRFDGFDWDNGNLKKVLKHGLTIDEIEIFFRQKVLVREDQDHSQQERRWIAVGLSINKRPIFVSYTLKKTRGHFKDSSD